MLSSNSLAVRLRFLVATFIVVVAILLGNGWLLSRNISTMRDHQQLVKHTQQVINQLEGVMASVSGAETRLRGYLIADDLSVMTNFQRLVDSARERIRGVQLLVADNPKQSKNAEELERLVNQRVGVFDETLRAFEKTKKIDADIFRRGSELTDSLRRLVDSMEAHEHELLERREAASVEGNRIVQLTLGAGTLLNFLLAVAVFALIRRQIVRQDTETREQTREALLKSAEAEAATLVGGDRPISQIGDELVEFIAKGTNSPAANFYLIDDGRLILEAGYAFREREVNGVLKPAHQVRIGEGLLGSAALRPSITEITDVPEDHFRVRTGFGDSLPRQLFLVPVRFQGTPVALIEVASFGALTEEQREWLQVAAIALGAGVASTLSRQRLQSLLEETQRQSEELQTQQEELRTSNEELEEQTRALLQSQERLQVQQEELQQVNEELEQQTRALELQREAVSLRNQDLEVAKSEVEKKALELERTSAYKSEFLAKMSHELRTPLNSLMILATLLHENKQGNLSSQQVDFARTIYESGGDLLNLINDILDLSKLEARKLTARPEPFALRTFFDQMVSNFKPMVETKGLNLAVSIEDGVPDRLITDRQRLQQILRNLLSNAVKFTETGSVTLTASPGTRPDRVKLTVRDTGVGIPEEKKQLIFEAFEQADGSVSRKYGGTGLGLTISRELAALLGGQIFVDSKVGEGSSFSLEIPVDLGASQAERGAVAPVEDHFEESSVNSAASVVHFVKAPTREVVERSPRAGGEGEVSQRVAEMLKAVPTGAKTILIVEDDEVFRASVAEAARSHDFFPIEIEDGESALEVLHQHVPHAILLDIRLPGVSGLTVLETIKEMPELRHVPIHMISALEHQQSALRMGAVGYLGKPVTIDGVRSALSRIENVISRAVKRLLVVEDDAAQRKAITELVQGGDVEIVAVGSGKDAIDALRQSNIDCVILDLSLPDCSGFELLERLNEREDISLPPVIVYTGKDLSKDEEERLRRYSDSIIIKGAKSPERLLDEVSLFLHRVETALPEEKRAMLADLRNKDRAFDGRDILIVDDDLRNVFALTSALESKGFHVRVARNGLEALEALDQHPSIDVVLMDIMMPKMDGFEAMRRIRTNPQFRKLPVIALTAKTMKGEYERCIEAGASDYLPKPINLPNLLSVLKVWLPPPGIMA